MNTNEPNVSIGFDEVPVRLAEDFGDGWNTVIPRLVKGVMAVRGTIPGERVTHIWVEENIHFTKISRYANRDSIVIRAFYFGHFDGDSHIEADFLFQIKDGNYHGEKL